MRRINVLKGASLAALLAAANGAIAQEALPTIDVGAAAQRDSGGAAKGGPKDPTAYHVVNTSAATKTDTPIMQTPINVEVVPKQVIQDQQSIVIDDVTRNVSNVFPSPYLGLQGGYIIRGFTDYAYYQDGVRVNPYAALPQRDTVDVQQVEIVKGPSSIMYGRMQPGGLVEVTTKMPQEDAHYEIQQLFGSYDTYRTTLSSTGPVTKDKSVLYRFDASYQTENSFMTAAHDRHVFLAPKILWAPTQDTSFLFYLQYYGGRDPINPGVPALYDPSLKKSWYFIPQGARSFNYGSADAALDTKSDFRVGYRFTHSFNNDWKIVHRLDLNFRDFTENYIEAYNPDPTACTASSCPVGRGLAQFYGKEQNYFTSIDLTGHFDTLGAEHTLLVGADGYRTNDFQPYNANYSIVPDTSFFYPPHPTNLFQLASTPSKIAEYRATESWYGVYAQDQIKLPYNVQVLAGFRYDSARATNGSTRFYSYYKDNTSTAAEDAIKPRVGLLWQPIPQLSLYGSYIEGFGMSNGLDTELKPLPPEQSRQWEGGAKVSLFDDRLTATASWFNLVKTHISSPLPPGVTGGLPIAETTGAVRNTGFEFDVQGQVTPELKIIGSYANIDSKVISDTTSGKVGNHWYGVPRNSGSLWAVYEPQFEPLRGFAFGAGFFARDAVWVDKNNTFMLPGYTTVDLMSRYSFEYEKKKVTFQFNVANLTDRTYWVTPGYVNLNPGAPRTFKGSMKIEF
ncbi:TonB-dependent siderophore receptor [Methylosinus sporium]|uniref:TonB-dependent siderophore receptor n=1 Tax=Methylosinus sporium TaxID=428 RepID=UPI00383BE6AA